jgi:hypothetical protein
MYEMVAHEQIGLTVCAIHRGPPGRFRLVCSALEDSRFAKEIDS